MQLAGTYRRKWGRSCKKINGPFGFGYYTNVYAIEAKNAGRIKFGKAVDVDKRFNSIRTMSPVDVVLLGSVALPEDGEAFVHDYLRDERLHGEWFIANQKARHMADLIVAKSAVEIAKLVGMEVYLQTERRGYLSGAHKITPDEPLDEGMKEYVEKTGMFY